MKPKVAVSVPAPPQPLLVGIDLGGTKIEGVLMDADGNERPRQRVATPRNDYEATVAAIAAMVENLLADAAGPGVDGGAATIGVATPGSLSPRTGRECVR
jgi:fructokinase